MRQMARSKVGVALASCQDIASLNAARPALTTAVRPANGNRSTLPDSEFNLNIMLLCHLPQTSTKPATSVKMLDPLVYSSSNSSTRRQTLGNATSNTGYWKVRSVNQYLAPVD